MELAAFLRIETKAQELGSQHHVLKILFKYVQFGEEGILEYPIRNGRADIFLQHKNQVIEVKTITQMTLEKLFSKILGVLGSESRQYDVLWVFYFYKLLRPSALGKNCQYLLTFIRIDLLEINKDFLKWELSRLVEESKEHVAEKLRVTPEIIIPLENLIKVEDLEHDLSLKEEIIVQKDQIIAQKDQDLTQKDQIIAEKESEIAQLKADLQKYQKSTKF